jgi:hypothetical protein
VKVLAEVAVAGAAAQHGAPHVPVRVHEAREDDPVGAAHHLGARRVQPGAAAIRLPSISTSPPSIVPRASSIVITWAPRIRVFAISFLLASVPSAIVDLRGQRGKIQA